jgi:UDP-N-acetylmuramate--alanine ligase
MKRWVKQVHFIGIGGIGMSGIAEVLLNLGFAVTGSDLRESPVTERLRGMGGRVVAGHDAGNIEGADVVVVSSAVKSDNPEVAAAGRRGIPVIPRAEMLAEIMRMSRGIAVAGSHGKTTTTAMIATVLSKAGLDPTAVVGGRLELYGSNARLGQGEWMVAEADESDGSFLHLSPTLVVVTNIDKEHMDHYKSMDSLHDTFVRFMNSPPFYGLVVACIDDPAVRALAPRIKRRKVTYGLSDDADIRAVEITCPGLGCEFVVIKQGERLGEVSLGCPGVFNALNALAALAVAFELDVDFKTAAAALKDFGGVGRRFEIKGENNGIMVVDDYAHHPTEIRAVLQAAREVMKSSDRGEGARLIAAFQPHRYTRTRDLWEEFANSFFEPDLLLTTEIYAASEAPLPGVSGEALYREVAKRRRERGLETRYVPEWSELAGEVIDDLGPGDLFLTLGAGSIYRSGEALLEMMGGGR